MSEPGGKHVDCHELGRRLYEFLDQELSDAECQAIRAHLEHCAGCDDQLRLEERFLSHLRDCCTADQAPPLFRERITIIVRETLEGRG